MTPNDSERYHIRESMTIEEEKQRPTCSKLYWDRNLSKSEYHS